MHKPQEMIGPHLKIRLRLQKVPMHPETYHRLHPTQYPATPNHRNRVNLHLPQKRRTNYHLALPTVMVPVAALHNQPVCCPVPHKM
jgi:hypothetical protein